MGLRRREGAGRLGMRYIETSGPADPEVGATSASFSATTIKTPPMSTTGFHHLCALPRRSTVQFWLRAVDQTPLTPAPSGTADVGCCGVTADQHSPNLRP